MGQPEDIWLYSSLIVLGAVGGALFPIYTERQARLLTFLSFAAGVMLGAAFFHMLPEAFHGGGYAAFTWLAAGFIVVFLLERYVLVHVCEEPPGCAEHSHPRGLGLSAFFGLSLHTLFDGVALGSASLEGVGLMTFIAIAAHKLPSSLSLAAILKVENRSRWNILLFVVLLGLMVPLGAMLYLGLDALLDFQAMASKALAFSAGSFLYLAMSDLLPHVNRHGKKDRFKHIAALVAGLALMLALTSLTHVGHGP